MKKRTLFGAILSTALITVAGAALAAGPQSGTDSDTSGSAPGGIMNQQAPATQGTMPSAMPTEGATMPGAMPPDTLRKADTQPALPPESVVGKTVINAEGDEIGEVASIFGDQVIVSVGGFLGVGTHDVALDWKQLKATGTGDDMKLETTLTKDELKSMPEHKN
jgi:hypothetical protein